MNVCLCFQEPESLLDLQISKWNPVIEWFSHRHDVKLIPSKNMSELPTIPKIDREKVRRQLLSYSFNAVQGFTFGVDALKSLILMSAIVEHKLSVEQAVQLARLETEFQVNVVSNVAFR
jgi:chaperone required for assembly of F1-ATPase